MSYQAVDWAKHHSPMLLTPKGKPDSTAREILVELAEHADEFGRNTHPSVLHIRWATGYDERTIQRALLRLERAKLIARVGVTRDGCVRWCLDMTQIRPETDWTELEAEHDKAKRVESERRAARRAKSKTADTSGTQSAGHIEPDVSTSDPVRDAESRRPARRIPASGTQSADVRDATPPEPPTNHQGNHQGTPTGGTLPPDPLRPDDPPGHRMDSESSPSTGGDQPPQPDTATHDRARENDPGPALRLVPGNPDATPTEDRPSLFPAAVPSPPGNPLRRPDRAAQVIAEATARRQAAIAAHRAAREASGE